MKDSWTKTLCFVIGILTIGGLCAIIYGDAKNRIVETKTQDGITIQTIEHDGRRYDIITKYGQNGWKAIPIEEK